MLLEPTVESLVLADYGKRTALPEDVVAEQARRLSGVYVDATFGRGGHSRALLARLSAQATLVVFDKDPQAIEVASELARTDRRVTVIHEAFGDMREALSGLGIEAIDGVMLDLGISSPQIDDAGRGFSFMRDGPLDMRMDTTRGETAAQWLAQASVQEMREVIVNYGEERFAFQIAKALIARRAVEPISSTRQLAALVAQAVKTREKGKDPATRTFQAIRIFINQELEELEAGLTQAYGHLGPYGRLVVISFHSLEDRIVKRFMASKASVPQPDRRLPIRAVDLPQPLMKLVSKMKPSDAEVAANPRARSAVMRCALRLPESGAAA